ncbi:hypothetical protein GCK72_019584 [Caenorhabditis remanei]|uniref:Serpentine Receptor, class H n=1 Tax=Caenorhabditis remanei TaxID=31234 RepID=A0A6A5GD05_CAERE|nr:hypothetical protein GCK72_019584 [Caenorhabditis remanei]KAF1753028.1 hypothetical protein GCK72_019584 [Caenorhabditis remanei]
MTLSYVHTPKFVSTSLHIMTCLEVPVHIFGIYIILWKTPESMKSVKWSMFNLHIWSMSLDLTVSLFTSPFVLFPAIAGFPLGLLKEFGVPAAAQAFLVVSIFAGVGVSILAIFENRFYVLFAGNTVWRFIRIPVLFVNYALCFLFFIPPYLTIPEQRVALEEVYRKLPSDLPPSITNGPVFVLATDATYALISIFLITCFIIGEIAMCIFFIWLNTKCLAKRIHLSRTTLKMQRKFLNALHVQMYTPLIILIVPLVYIAYSVYFNVYDQASNNLCLIMISFHGLASTTVMVLIHKSYREACIDIFCIKTQYKTNPIPESRRNSFVTYVPRSKIRDDVIVVSHQITY